MPACHSFNKAQTCYGLIDPQLTKRCWNLADRRSVSLEFPVDDYDAAPVNGVTDHCLYHNDGEVLAIIEVKRTRKDARVGSLTDFSKYVLKLEDVPQFADLIQKAFDAFILEHNNNIDQTRFLRPVKMITMQKRKNDVGNLYEPSFTNFGMNAVEKLFSEREVDEILNLTKTLMFSK